MPRKIEVLPESVSQIIAAGEVVERPASVVKELMENAIDAGSQDIVVELKSGGLQLIRVTDRGEGIEPEDAPVAIQRYATSKIKKAEDLYAVHTLGFRGEALCSIAQVSKLTLQSRTPHSLSGTKVVCEGGKIKSISEVGCPVGTEVEVRQLFYNIPVKRKFLKSIRSELHHALTHFLRLSLSHPAISFKFIHDGRVLHEYIKTDSPFVRVQSIFGKEIYPHLQPVRYEEREIEISGFSSLPSVSKRNAEGIYFYVNRRFIRDRMIHRAIVDAYRHRIPGNQFPVTILWIQLPPSTVDVNVHPTKTEVKFKDPEQIYHSIFTAIRMILEPDSSDLPKKDVEAEPGGISDRKRGATSLFAQGEFPSLTGNLIFAANRKAYDTSLKDGSTLQWEAENRRPYSILGQIQGTYILCEGDGKLIFIDQHAAHERILFERLKKDFDRRSIVSEKLLLPVLIELSAGESTLIESSMKAIKSIGFEIEPVGDKLFAIQSIPSFIGQKDPKEMVRRILDELSLLERQGRGEEAVQSILITMACHSAIRANLSLKDEEIQKLLEDLFPFAPSATCPHGRPIFFIFSLDELKKQFKRK